MANFCRKTYNSEYYARNKERIRQQRLQRQSQVQTFELKSQPSLFEIQQPMMNNQAKFQPINLEVLSLIAQCLLITGITYFLLREAVEFYRSNYTNHEQSILAAVLVEGLLIVFAFLQPSKLLNQILVKILLVALFGYASWSFSSNVIGKGIGALEQREILQKTISSVESAIAENDKAIQVFIAKEWLTAARKLTSENIDLRKRLIDLQQQNVALSSLSPEAQKSNTLALVILRLLFQAANIILVHQLSAAVHKHFKYHRRSVASFDRVGLVAA